MSSCYIDPMYTLLRQNNDALPGCVGNKGIYVMRTGEYRYKTERNKKTEAILGKSEHRKSRF